MKLFIYTLLLAGIVTGIYACKDDKDIIPDTHGRVMVFNTVPVSAAYPAFNILIDTVQVATNLLPGDTSSFSVFKAQKYNVNIFSSANLNNLLATGELNIRNNHSFSFFLTYDSSIDASTQSQVQAVASDDDLTAPRASNSNLRIANMSNTFAYGGRQLMTVLMDTDSTIIFNGISFRQVTNFVTIQPGTHTLYFRYYNDTISSHPIRDTMILKMDSTKIYTVYTAGSLARKEQFKKYAYIHYK